MGHIKWGLTGPRIGQRRGPPDTSLVAVQEVTHLGQIFWTTEHFRGCVLEPIGLVRGRCMGGLIKPDETAEMGDKRGIFGDVGQRLGCYGLTDSPLPLTHPIHPSDV